MAARGLELARELVRGVVSLEERTWDEGRGKREVG